MEQNIVRLVALEINNVKNVVHGALEFSSGRRGSILGIYGQNGSGKTVVVDCMVLLKCLLSGKNIPPNYCHYIHCQSNTANVKYCFQVKTRDSNIYAEYEVELLKVEKNRFCLSGEKLSMKEQNEEERTKLTPVFEYRRGDKELFRPLKYYQYFVKNIELMVPLGIAKQATEDFDEEKQKSEVSSFLFSKNAQEIFEKGPKETQRIFMISSILQSYGVNDLAVVENAHYGLLALNLDTLPVNIDWPESAKLKVAGVMLRLLEVNVVPKEVFSYIKGTMCQINIVLKSLVPDVELELYNVFEKLMEDGRNGIQFEVVTKRNGNRIPLLYESAGIKKIISICSNLVACYNRETYCLVVDELDSGIYEYLLGECLEVMQEKAKGQLIFTSHNLRPLEVLRNEFLVYTTVNPKERYLKTSYIKNTQNTRLSYLRSIKLGGQKEKLYSETNIYEIELAMKKAGRVNLHD